MTHRRRARLLILFIALPVWLPACGNRDSGTGVTPPGAPRPLIVVTTFTVLGDLIRQVGGDAVRVKALVPPGEDVHTYQPTPEDIKVVTKAKIVFYNGVHLEDWLTGTIRAVGRSDLITVVLSQGLTLLADSDGDPNPHLWLDVSNAKTYIEKIRDSLSQADPANAGAYAERARVYLTRLDELDAWIRAQVETIPKERRKLVTFHDAFPYFARGYGFSLQGFLVASPGKEPSARDLAALVARIRGERVPAVFAEKQFNPKAMEVLAKEAGVKVVTDLYNDSLSSGPEADTYLAMMKHDVAKIVGALK